MSYKAVFFDLDGTLRLTTPSPTAAFVQLVRSLNIEVDIDAEQQVQRWAHRYWGEEKVAQQDINQIDTDQFWLDYSMRLLESINVTQRLQERACLVRDWFYQEYNPHVDCAPGTRHTLQILQEQGYYVGLISNRSSPLNGTVTELALDGFFNLTLAAGEIGCWKPNQEIFLSALQRADGIQPHEAIYVGDNYYADCLGARAAGMTPILFDPDNLYEDVDCIRIRHIAHVLDALQPLLPS